MGRTDDILGLTDEKLAGVRGQIALVRERQGGLTVAMVRSWITRLRNAAELLEDLT